MREEVQPLGTGWRDRVAGQGGEGENHPTDGLRHWSMSMARPLIKPRQRYILSAAGGRKVDKDRYVEMAFEEQRKKKRVAYLLWLLFGWFGVHRLYAGKTRSGLIQMLLTLTVVGFVFVTFWWWLIDALLVPDMVNEHNLKTLHLINASGAPEEMESSPGALTIADSRRERMLEELRQAGYRKEPRSDLGSLYR